MRPLISFLSLVLCAMIQPAILVAGDQNQDDLSMQDMAALMEMVTLWNREGTDYFASLGKHRPHALSCKASYTSWDSLTDKNYYARHLPPADQEWMDSLPSMEDVTELFRIGSDQERREDSRSTMLFATFAQYVVETIVATAAKPDGTPIYEQYAGTHEIDLMAVYGRTVEQTNVLRTMNDAQGSRGRLKSQLLHGEEFPPFLYLDDGTVDPQFLPLVEESTTTFPNTPTSRRCRVLEHIDNSTFFAMGHMDGNLLPNIVALNTLFLREHNRVAANLETLYPEWDDERVFQTARSINIVIFIKLIVDEYINHISTLPIYHLDVGPWIWNATWNKPNWVAAEFSVLYRFHAMVPSNLHLAGEEVPIMSSLGRNDMFVDGTLSLRETFEDLSAQKAMSMELFNTDPFLLQRETEALRMSRALNFRSYADYVEYWGDEARPTKFEDISSDPQIVAKLKELYGTVDNVEYYVGLVAQDHLSNGVFGGSLTAAVALDAFSQVLTNPLLSENIWNQETFSSYGWKLVNEKQTLELLLERNTPKQEESDKAYIGMGDTAPLPNINGAAAATSKQDDDDGTMESNIAYESSGSVASLARSALLLATAVVQLGVTLFGPVS